MEELDIDEIIINQPTMNIGMIGSVSNGKSSLVKNLTGTKTQRHSHEQKRNITIKLGYANAKIFKCQSCEPPKCYQSFGSDKKDASCEHCGEYMNLEKHVSFVDCPGHFMLMATMLNGTCIMDSTILVEAASNKEMPAQQTVEHMVAADILDLNNEIVCMNKIDLVKKEVANKRIKDLENYIQETVAKGSPIIPIAAHFGINSDVVCEYICTKVTDIKKDLDSDVKMVIIRSFNINHQNVEIKGMKGGVIGGTITKGVLRIGQKIKILPGIIERVDGGWIYEPIVSMVKSINSEKNDLKLAIPGGLIGVQLTIDPALTAKDGLVGNIMVSEDFDNPDYKIYQSIGVIIEIIKDDIDLKKRDLISINHNACNIKSQIIKIKKEKKENGMTIKAILKLLEKPICAQKGDHITVSLILQGSKVELVGRGKIMDGDESQLKD